MSLSIPLGMPSAFEFSTFSSLLTGINTEILIDTRIPDVATETTFVSVSSILTSTADAPDIIDTVTPADYTTIITSILIATVTGYDTIAATGPVAADNTANPTLAPPTMSVPSLGSILTASGSPPSSYSVYYVDSSSTAAISLDKSSASTSVDAVTGILTASGSPNNPDNTAATGTHIYSSLPVPSSMAASVSSPPSSSTMSANSSNNASNMLIPVPLIALSVSLLMIYCL